MLFRVSVAMLWTAGLMARVAAAGFVTGQNADLVLGQPNFTSKSAAASATGAFQPHGIAIDPVSHKVFVSQSGLNAVYRYGSADALASGSPAEAILGQPNFGTTSADTSRSKMSMPTGLAFDPSGRLWVSDAGNCRVLRFDDAATKPSGANADGVLGQADFTSIAGIYGKCAPDLLREPAGLCVDSAGNLWVADRRDNRVVRFDAADLTTDGAAAKIFLGVMNSTISVGTESPTAYSTGSPTAVVATGSGDIYVASMIHNRVLRYTGAVNYPDGDHSWKADSVIGQKDFNSVSTGSAEGIVFSGVGGIAVDAAGTLYVTETGQCRVSAIPNAASIVTGGTVAIALGEPELFNIHLKIPPTVASLHMPVAVTVDYAGRVWVADYEDNRVVRYIPGDSPTFTLGGKSHVRTSASSIVLRGKISGEAGARVYVKVGNKGKFRRARGGSKWTFKAKLKVGKNVIKIYALDAMGRKSHTKTMIVIRTN